VQDPQTEALNKSISGQAFRAGSLGKALRDEEMSHF